MGTARKPLGVFCGPSLPDEDRIAVRGVAYLAPASRGDVEAAGHEFEALLLIDGVFHHDLAPSPKEVYAACSRVKMLGASSMGALRAAECWPFGMVPLGIIVRWYMREIIDGDDEVAVLVHPHTQRSLTVPLVNVRYVAWLAQRRGLLSRDEAQHWVLNSREIFYMDRSWEEVLGRAPVAARDTLEELARAFGDLKRRDARFALRSAARSLGLPYPRFPKLGVSPDSGGGSPGLGWEHESAKRISPTPLLYPG